LYCIVFKYLYSAPQQPTVGQQRRTKKHELMV